MGRIQFAGARRTTDDGPAAPPAPARGAPGPGGVRRAHGLCDRRRHCPDARADDLPLRRETAPRGARALADGESYDAAALGRPQRDHTGRFYQMREIRERHGLFVDDSNHGAGTACGYSSTEVEALVTKAQGVVARRDYGRDYFLEALTGHVANGSSVTVIGSAEPWHEAVCLALNASRVTTVDYGSRTYEHPQLDQVNASFWNQLGDANLNYDVVVAASALDHDGLGRYGDPIAPDGDLLTMRLLLRTLAPGAKVLVSVPVGPDRIIWNLMRIYGKDRLARLIDGTTSSRA